MAREVKILRFAVSFPHVDNSQPTARKVNGQFENHYDFPGIEAEIGRYLSVGFSIVGCNYTYSSTHAGYYLVTLQR